MGVDGNGSVVVYKTEAASDGRLVMDIDDVAKMGLFNGD